MDKKVIDKTIVIPNGISISIDKNLIKVKGSKYEIERKLSFPNIKIELSDTKIKVISKYNTRNYKRTINSISSHIRNMIKGVEVPYIYRLKVCSGHFPMKVTYEQNKIVVSNFLGEKIPRRALILPGVNVKIEADNISLSGPDKEAVGQSAANVETATRITNRDRRIFQDGIFIIK